MRSPSAATIRRAEVGDAEAWVATFLDAMADTYVEIMPPEFFVRQRARAPEYAERYRAVFAAQRADPANPQRALIAEDAAGVVGVAETRLGPAEWEVEAGYPAAGPALQLARLYLLPRRHGTGLGQAMLDLAIGDAPAYLWIMAGNPRAEAFYRRNGFVPDGLAVPTGPSWYDRPAFRMHRPARTGDQEPDPRSR